MGQAAAATAAAVAAAAAASAAAAAAAEVATAATSHQQHQQPLRHSQQLRAQQLRARQLLLQQPQQLRPTGTWPSASSGSGWDNPSVSIVAVPPIKQWPVVQLLKLPAEVPLRDRVAQVLARHALLQGHRLQDQTFPDWPPVPVTPAVARADPSEGSENGPSATAHRTAHLAVPTAGPLGDDESDDEFWREVSMPIDLDVAPSTCDGGSTTASAGDSHLHATATPASDASGARPCRPRMPRTAAPKARPTHRREQPVLLMSPPSAADEAETESSAVAPPAAAWEPLGRRIAP
mmetsp:Transcript_151723/g.484949  ORF Transcript_151723/g.484949 Transcript_151723/m.484949 type:complete len:292 (-) Transcript_151723:353-1228(-)